MSLKSDKKPEKQNYWWSPLKIVAWGNSAGYRSHTLFQPSSDKTVDEPVLPSHHEQVKPK